MSDKEILQAIKFEQLEINPFHRERLGPVSYDIETRFTNQIGRVYRLVSIEEFKLSRNIVGIISQRSNTTKRGIWGTFSTLVDPGYKGHLIFLVQSFTGVLDPRDLYNLFQITFFRVDKVEVAYNERKSSTAMNRRDFNG